MWVVSQYGPPDTGQLVRRRHHRFIPASLWCYPIDTWKRTTLPEERILPCKKVLPRALFSRLCMIEVSNNFFAFFKSYKNKQDSSYRKDILNSVNWWQLMVPWLTLFFPWPGPIIDVGARRRKLTSVLTSIVVSDGKGPERPFVSKTLESGETGSLIGDIKNFALL